MTATKVDLSSSEPTLGSRPLYQALWWIAKGDFKTGDEWEQAHNICQAREGNNPYDWVHALLHWIEGDEWNANYWYRHIGKNRQGKNFEEEWQIIVDQIL